MQDETLVNEFTHQAVSFNGSAVARASETLDELIALAEPRTTQRWLDAACGPGIVSRRLALMVRQVHGVDLTPAMIDLARQEAASAGLGNASFEVADATATGLAGASFDGAITRFAIHHLPLPGRLFEELARVVRPGGEVVVADHVADADAEAYAWSQEIERLRDPSHWSCLTVLRLRELGRRAGLELTQERLVAFELDFDDWLERGSTGTERQALVQRALRQRPASAECFHVADRGGRRVLELRLWLSRWRRPSA